MAYSLEFHPERVTLFIRQHPTLTRETRIRLFVNLHSDLAVRADHYMADESRRLAPGSEYFWYRAVAHTAEGRTSLFWFVVNSAPAPYGVLRLEYVEERVWD